MAEGTRGVSLHFSPASIDRLGATRYESALASVATTGLEQGGKGEVGAKRVTRTWFVSRQALKATVHGVKVKTQEGGGPPSMSDGWHTEMSDVKLTADFCPLPVH